jgi:hypothetical protein
MKTINTADKYLSYYSVLRKMVNWPNVSAKLCTMQYIFVYKTLAQTKTSCKRQQGSKYRKSRTQMSTILMNCYVQRNNQQQGGLNSTPQADCTGISTHIHWTKLLLVRKASSILQDRVKCTGHTRSEVKHDTFANSALFCFTKGFCREIPLSMNC